MSVGPKEDVYDELISPLVAKVIKLCKGHGIPVFVHFELDDYCDDDGEERRCMCTTSLPLAPKGDPGNGRLAMMVRASRVDPSFVAMTMTASGSKGGGV
jgi:hypothetical protein